MSTFQRCMQALALTLSALVAAPAAQAITPESGFWYNVSEPGTGISIEITDNFLFMAAYGFDNAGFPTWYTSGGFMSSDRQYNGGLAEFRNGQRFGGLWVAPTYLGNTGGDVAISFDPNDETRATITWFGRTYAIQRTDFFRSAYGIVNNIHQTQRMLGEWTMVFDLYNRDTSYRAFPFFGDVLIFDLVDTASNPDFYEGCRPTNSLTGFCTATALSTHDAAGYYDSATGDQVFVVRDVPASGSSGSIFFAYFASTALTEFDGVVSIYTPPATPGTGPFYPVRGFRTASRKFVVDGSGPNAVDPDAGDKALAPVSLYKSILDSNGGVLPPGLTAAEVQQRYGMDVSKLATAVKPLEQRMQSNNRRNK